MTVIMIYDNSWIHACRHYYFVVSARGLFLTQVIMWCKIQQLMQTCPWLATKTETRWQRRRGGIWAVSVLCVCLCVCMSWCVSIKWLRDRQKIDGNHCIFFAILLFSEHVCVLRNMPKITSLNHQPPMMLFFFSLSLPWAGNLMCVVVYSS